PRLDPAARAVPATAGTARLSPAHRRPAGLDAPPARTPVRLAGCAAARRAAPEPDSRTRTRPARPGPYRIAPEPGPAGMAAVAPAGSAARKTRPPATPGPGHRPGAQRDRHRGTACRQHLPVSGTRRHARRTCQAARPAQRPAGPDRKSVV